MAGAGAPVCGNMLPTSASTACSAAAPEPATTQSQLSNAPARQQHTSSTPTTTQQKLSNKTHNTTTASTAIQHSKCLPLQYTLTEDPEVSVLIPPSRVAGEEITLVAREVGLLKAVMVIGDCAHHAGPGALDDQVAARKEGRRQGKGDRKQVRQRTRARRCQVKTDERGSCKGARSRLGASGGKGVGLQAAVPGQSAAVQSITT